jgi:ribonucleoside-diphosphate reductase alpha chain
LIDLIDINIYKTAYEISPFKQIDMAAIFQKHVDQAVSKSLYVADELREKIADIYIYA